MHGRGAPGATGQPPPAGAFPVNAGTTRSARPRSPHPPRRVVAIGYNEADLVMASACSRSPSASSRVTSTGSGVPGLPRCPHPA
ncbi:hypothetical protein HBB16_21835 [Pseudonocardia sp. MCCB 268]|nr:hypothetical protein [Pseudonocardia cytotoxica]